MRFYLLYVHRMTSLDLQASVVKIGVNEQFYPDDTAFMITEFKLGLKFKCSNSVWSRLA